MNSQIRRHCFCIKAKQKLGRLVTVKVAGSAIVPPYAILANRGEVVIGHNCIFAASSVLMQSIPPRSILAGLIGVADSSIQRRNKSGGEG